MLLSARRIGPTGFPFGLGMTDEMLALARRNAAEQDIANVQFLKGEHIPLPDASVDVVISHCGINLSADKAPVLHEAFRVFEPGGRFAVSDVVVEGDLPAELRQGMERWRAGSPGALEEHTYRRFRRHPSASWRTGVQAHAPGLAHLTGTPGLAAIGCATGHPPLRR